MRGWVVVRDPVRRLAPLDPVDLFLTDDRIVAVPSSPWTLLGTGCVFQFTDPGPVFRITAFEPSHWLLSSADSGQELVLRGTSGLATTRFRVEVDDPRLGGSPDRPGDRLSCCSGRPRSELGPRRQCRSSGGCSKQSISTFSLVRDTSIWPLTARSTHSLRSSITSVASYPHR